MIDAQYISEALNGKKAGNSYACDCPVNEHSRAKMYVTDKADGVLIHCHAGCSFQEMVAALKTLGLWPEKSPEQQRLIEKKRVNRESITAIGWIQGYERDPTIRTKADDRKYLRLISTYKYKIWARKVIDEQLRKLIKGKRLSDKQITTLFKAIDII